MEDVKAAGSLPILATIPPANPSWPGFLPDRNSWVSQQNVLIRTLAKDEGAVLADVEAAFLKAGGSDLGQLFSNNVHPNDRGYAILADTFFAAITQPGSGTSSLAAPHFREPGAHAPPPKRR